MDIFSVSSTNKNLVRFVQQAIPFKRDKGNISRSSICCVDICGIGSLVAETGQVCTDGHLREENSDRIFHVTKYP